MKQYSLITLGMEHTLPVTVEGSKRYIKFVKVDKDDNKGFFETNDKKLQKAIEESSFFENKEISLIFSDESDDEELLPAKGEKQTQKQLKGAKEFEPAEFPDVTEFKQAKDILTGEPYNVGKTSKSLASPEGILAKAGELGISFPNLNVAE